jgi:hypothetical protein
VIAQVLFSKNFSKLRTMKQLIFSLACIFSLSMIPLTLFSQSETPTPTPAQEQAKPKGITISGPAGVNISGPTTICKGGETILKAEGDYESFEWNNGVQDRFLRVKEEGTYEVTVTTKGGCRFTTSVTVRMIPCT